MKFMVFPELAQLSQTLSHSSQECTVHTRIEAYSCKPIKKDKKLSKAMENSFQEIKAEIRQSVGSPDEEDEALYASAFGHLNKPQSRKTLYLLIQLLNVAFPDYDFSESKPDHFNKEMNGSNVLQALSATLYTVRTQSGPHLVYAPRSYALYPPTTPEFFKRTNSLNISSSPMSVSSMPRSPVLSAASSPDLASSTVHALARSLPSLPQPLSSGIHPMLYRVLDKVISLTQCEVYSYIPDADSDPHADDSDSDVGSSEDGVSSEDEGEYDFVFDDFNSGSPPKPTYRSWDDVEDLNTSASSSKPPPRKVKQGGLLWSSHWFFYNKKLKRILFITIWAKKRRGTIQDIDDDGGFSSLAMSENADRFRGWEGGVGAGARALGLPVRG